MARSGPPHRGDAGRDAQRRQRLIMIVVGVVVLIAAVGIAVLTTGDDDEAALAVEDVAGDLDVDGEALPPADDPSADPAVGTPAPVIVGEDFSGSEVTIGDPGSPQLLMFLASWCPICEQELPEVVEWVDDGRLPDGVELTAIATGLDDSRPNWPPQDWFEAEGYEGRLLVDDGDGTVSETYGLTATPYWVALDADGEVVARLTGMLEPEQLDALASLVAGS